MDSLTYIAKRLEVEVAELLEEVNIQELRDVLEIAEKLYNIDYEKLTDQYAQLVTLVRPFVSKLTQGYESARLLEMYSRCLCHEKEDNWQVYADKAAQLYEQMNLTTKRADMGIFRSMVKFIDHSYEDSLKILLQERANIEENNTFIDPMTRLNFDFHEAFLHFAVGDSISAVRVMNEAFNFSKKNRFFYNIDPLYRLATIHAMIEGNEEQTNHYLEKLVQYGNFAEDKLSIFFSEFAKIHYLNSYKKSYEDALLLVNHAIDKYDAGKEQTPYSPLLNLEKGKALFGLNQYEEALRFLTKVTIADYLHHPLDLSIFYECDAYTALCYIELNNLDEAAQYAKKALNNISALPSTPYKDFIYETYKYVCQRP